MLEPRFRTDSVVGTDGGLAPLSALIPMAEDVT